MAASLERVLARLDEDADWNDALYTPLNVDVDVVESGTVARRTELDFANACRTYLPTHGLLLLGDPGGGKSTSLRHLARHALREVGQTGVLAIHANLRQWVGADRVEEDGALGLLAFIRASLRGSLDAADADFLDAHLDGLISAGRVAFLLDSFDEIPILLDRDDASDALQALSAQLERLVTLPGSPMLLVASRAFRRPRLRAREFLIVELRPFTDARLHALAEARGGVSQERLDAFLGRGGPWLKHARNPFMAMLLFNHLARHDGQEPKDLAALYEGFVTARLVTGIGEANAERVVRAAQAIAEAMLVGTDGGLEGSLRAVSERLSDVDVVGAVDALVGVRIMRRGSDGDSFTFVHRRFNEYFLALRWQAEGAVPDLSAIIGDRKERDALVIHVEVAPEAERRRVLAWCLGFVAEHVYRGHWWDVAAVDAAATSLRGQAADPRDEVEMRGLRPRVMLWQPPARPPTRAEVLDAVVVVVAATCGGGVDGVQPGLGLDSDTGVDVEKRAQIVDALRERFELPDDAFTIEDCPTVEAVAERLAKHVGATNEPATPDTYVVLRIDEATIVVGPAGTALEPTAAAASDAVLPEEPRCVVVTVPKNVHKPTVHVAVGDTVMEGTILLSWHVESHPRDDWWSTELDDPDRLPAVPLGPEDALPADRLVRVTRAVRFLDDAFGRQPDRIPAAARALLVQHVDLAINSGTSKRPDLLQMKLALEVVGLLPPETVGRLLTRVLQLRNPWLNDVALRAARFVRTLDASGQTALLGWIDTLEEDDLLARGPELLRVSGPGMLLSFLRADLEAQLARASRARWLRPIFVLLNPLTLVIWAFGAFRARRRSDRERRGVSSAIYPALVVSTLLAVLPSSLGVYYVAQPVRWLMEDALGLSDASIRRYDTRLTSVDADTPEGRDIIAQNLPRLRRSRAAQVGDPAYARELVRTWVLNALKPALWDTYTEEVQEDVLRAWWTDHPELFAEGEERWTYRMLAFATIDDAEAFLRAERDAGRSADQTFLEAPPDTRNGAQLRPAGSFQNKDATVASTLAPMEVSKPYTVDIGLGDVEAQAVHVVWLESHTPAGPAEFSSEIALRVYREGRSTELVKTFLEERTADVQPLRDLGEVDDEQVTIFHYFIVDMKSSKTFFARAYAAAWSDSTAVANTRVQQTLADALNSERSGITDYEFRYLVASLREILPDALSLVILLVGVGALSHTDLRKLREFWWKRWLLVVLPLLVPALYLISTVIDPISHTFNTVYRMFYHDSYKQEGMFRAAKLLRQHLTFYGPPVVEQPVTATGPVTAAGPSVFQKWISWMDAHVGVIEPGVWFGVVQVALPAVVVLILALAYLPGGWQAFRDRGFDMSHKLRAALTWLGALFFAPLLLWALSSFLVYSFNSTSFFSTGHDLYAFGLVVFVCFLTLVVRAFLTVMGSWQGRLGRAWQFVSWGGVLALGGVLLVVLWPIHRPLMRGGILAVYAMGIAGLIHAFLMRSVALVAAASSAGRSTPAPPISIDGWTHRRGIAQLLAEATDRDIRYALLDLIAAKHLEAGTVPTGEWSGGSPPYFVDDVASSTRLAQFDEKWRGLDR